MHRERTDHGLNLRSAAEGHGHDKARPSGGGLDQVAQRLTLPDFRQEVQTLSRFGVPDTTARTRWMLGLHCRLVFFFDQGTL